MLLKHRVLCLLATCVGVGFALYEGAEVALVAHVHERCGGIAQLLIGSDVEEIIDAFMAVLCALLVHVLEFWLLLRPLF